MGVIAGRRGWGGGRGVCAGAESLSKYSVRCFRARALLWEVLVVVGFVGTLWLFVWRTVLLGFGGPWSSTVSVWVFHLVACRPSRIVWGRV